MLSYAAQVPTADCRAIFAAVRAFRLCHGMASLPETDGARLAESAGATP
ncbi:hypothetical protein [Methylobacterium nodulans]|uniref:Uncharacterized protein n=1 Tax=Methylobacterium nodulans (strain LMG 21967 / CNCM I-2342 / ORS 2060) TaxID=460265 RepID=B8IT57_METNO|nr:hypothetical protein [Methylobacterium nodulans]ACL56943.1 hypothetical protein Mnod_1954 [Methylobacterium nodulans ORS 2060]